MASLNSASGGSRNASGAPPSPPPPSSADDAPVRVCVRSALGPSRRLCCDARRDERLLGRSGVVGREGRRERDVLRGAGGVVDGVGMVVFFRVAPSGSLWSSSWVERRGARGQLSGNGSMRSASLTRGPTTATDCSSWK